MPCILYSPFDKTNRTLPDWNVKSHILEQNRKYRRNRTLPDWNVKQEQLRKRLLHKHNRTLPDWNVKRYIVYYIFIK